MRHRHFWLAAGWLIIASICYLSLIHNPPQPMAFRQADKVEHLVAYFLLMAWFCQLYHRPGERLRLALGFAALGGDIEILQGLVGYRSAEWMDLVADCLGVGVAWLLSTTRFQFFLSHVEARLSLRYDRHH